jgi:putative phosphoesterase
VNEPRSGPVVLKHHAFDGDLLIGLISDTHIPEARATLYDEVYTSFRGVDLILHSGDMHDVVVLDWLGEVAPVVAVRGNGDDGDGGRPIAPDDDRLAYNQLLHVNGLKIGMTHAFPERPCGKYLSNLDDLMTGHFGGPVDIVIAGDTHVPVIAKWDGVTIVNSGSPMFPHNFNTQLGTVGFLQIRGRHAEAWIEQLH